MITIIICHLSLDMRTQLHPDILVTTQGQRANDIIKQCVHCGFCNATCPTYLETQNELDGPRGRIYLMHEALAQGQNNVTAQHHLDRCLTCRSCETTCPSGVEYGELLDLTQGALAHTLKRPFKQRLLRMVLATLMTYSTLSKILYRIASWFRPLLGPSLKARLPPRIKAYHYQSSEPQAQLNLNILLLPGCIQSYASPGALKAAQELLQYLGAKVSIAPARCCGALHHHTGMPRWASRLAKGNVKNWQQHEETIVVSLATGCGVHVKDYPKLYPQLNIGAMPPIKDIAEIIGHVDPTALPRIKQPQRVAWHEPCTFRHGQKLELSIPALLEQVGYLPTQVANSHLCCGSAGAYSIEQPEMSNQLRQQKLGHLLQDRPEIIATANIGCQLHLASATNLPVRHWIELLAAPLQKEH